MVDDLASRGYERFDGWGHSWEDLSESLKKEEAEKRHSEIWVGDTRILRSFEYSSERWWSRDYANDIKRRMEVQETARAFLEYPFVVFDTETTGLDSSGDEIVQIGVVNHRGELLLDTLIKPRYPIPEEATDIHGISNEDVANAPSFREVYDELYRVLDNQRWAGYNLSFDSSFIRWECRRRGLWVPGTGSKIDNWQEYELDVMELYAKWWGDWSEYHGSYRWQKLSVANERHHLYDGQAHNAVADAMTTLNLLKMMGEKTNV